MTKATIGLSIETKRSLAAAKPRDMPWDSFIIGLLESCDPSRFESVVGIKQDESEQDAADRAKQRYLKYRKQPDALLTGTELRRRIHLRRLLESLSRAQSSLKLTDASPHKGDMDALRDLLDDLDEQIHEARELFK